MADTFRDPSPFEIYPETSRECILRCPRVKVALDTIEKIRACRDRVAEASMDNPAEEVMERIKSSIPPEFLEKLDEQATVELMKQQRIGVVDGLSASVGQLEGSVRDMSVGCDGPFDAIGVDCAGRTIGVFVCRSPSSEEGMQIEPAEVFRSTTP